MIELVSSMMGLSIPILAIFAFSPMGRAVADSIRAKSAASQVVAPDSSLEARVKALETELHQLREAIVLAPGPRVAGPHLSEPDSSDPQSVKLSSGERTLS